MQSESNELIRLAQRGHVFSVGEGRAFVDNINQAPMRGPSDTQQEQS